MIEKISRIPLHLNGVGVIFRKAQEVCVLDIYKLLKNNIKTGFRLNFILHHAWIDSS